MFCSVDQSVLIFGGWPVQEDEDENAEADADMEEGKLQWAGGRKEEATYDAGEAEDVAIQAANEPPEVWTPEELL